VRFLVKDLIGSVVVHKCLRTQILSCSDVVDACGIDFFSTEIMNSNSAPDVRVESKPGILKQLKLTL
jgi:hypothetical protein